MPKKNCEFTFTGITDTHSKSQGLHITGFSGVYEFVKWHWREAPSSEPFPYTLDYLFISCYSSVSSPSHTPSANLLMGLSLEKVHDGVLRLKNKMARQRDWPGSLEYQERNLWSCIPVSPFPGLRWIWELSSSEFIHLLYCDHCFMWWPVAFQLTPPSLPSQWVMPLPWACFLLCLLWCHQHLAGTT